MRTAVTLSLAAACVVALAPGGPGVAGAPTEAPREASLGPLPIAVAGGRLKVEVCAEDIVRVAFAKDDAFFARPTLATAGKRCRPTPWKLRQGNGEATIATAKLTVRVDLATGAVSFADAAGRPILAERPGGRTLEPATVMGDKTFHVRQQWQPAPGESLYGLGQHQQGLLDIKDVDLDLRQVNGEIVIPFLVSSRGWGILWDNTSFTRFGDLGDAVPLPVEGLYAPGTGGAPGDVAISPRGTAEWTGTVVAQTTGDFLFRTYSSGTIKLTVDGRAVVDHFRQGWLAGEDIARVPLRAGQKVAIGLQWKSDIGVKIANLRWKPPVADRTTSLWSKVGDGVDYTFVYGPGLDRVIAGYRTLTGAAPMMPRWAFGLWQCRERYRTQKESLDVLDEFRRRGIPVDAIVQDWRYWPEGQWGSHRFDPARFPDPAAWTAGVHARHARVMISVWPKFYRGTDTFAALDAGGFLYRANITEQRKDFLGNVYTYYDAFNPDARRLFWSEVKEAIDAKGVDAWWVDASEPEVVEGPYPSVAASVDAAESHMNPTAAGSGARVLNAYALVHSQGIYEGVRAAHPDRRVFILTRNGFAGMQRYAAASWSGDVTSTWTALAKQVPAGLGFAISGMPYWTFDTGGFSVPDRFARAPRGSAALDEWRELNARWFEYAAFTPLLRVHGQAPKREMWELGDAGSAAYDAELKADRLRYRLLPYVYTLAGDVTQAGGTIMRPLVMDFPADAAARAVGDAYMFGPALLVAPVTAYKARARDVYLPATPGGWYDLWTGAAIAPGTRRAPAPTDAIPVHVRAGAIVPVGPPLVFSDEKAPDPITLWIYAGADGAFSLYEDDGVSTAYERGAFTRIPLVWHDATRTLTIGRREGTFPGMLARRSFEVVVVSPRAPSPFLKPAKPARAVPYAGDPIEIRAD